jgi:hypothetical protein
MSWHLACMLSWQVVAALKPCGWAQVKAAQEHWAASGLEEGALSRVHFLQGGDAAHCPHTHRCHGS